MGRRTVFRVERVSGQSRYEVREYPCPDGLGGTHGTTRARAVAQCRQENAGLVSRLEEAIEALREEAKRKRQEFMRVRVVTLGKPGGPCVAEWEEPPDAE